MLDEIEISHNHIYDATSDAHIGMQLIGGAHCVVSHNELTGAIIQPGTGRSPDGHESRIEDNTIDLDQLGLAERGAIFIGAGVSTTGLVIQRNVIRNGVDDDFARADRGIRLASGSDITISNNKIMGVYTGIHAFARTDLDPANEPIRNLVVDGNEITGGAVSAVPLHLSDRRAAGDGARQQESAWAERLGSGSPWVATSRRISRFSAIRSVPAPPSDPSRCPPNGRAVRTSTLPPLSKSNRACGLNEYDRRRCR